MANEKTTTPEQPVSLSFDQLKTLLEEVKKPYIDPDVQTRLDRHRARIRAQRDENEALREARERSCAHLRRDGTSTVAWMTTPGPDNYTPFTRGVCQRCLKLFLPGDPAFNRMIAVPTGSDEGIYA